MVVLPILSLHFTTSSSQAAKSRQRNAIVDRDNFCTCVSKLLYNFIDKYWWLVSFKRAREFASTLHLTLLQLGNFLQVVEGYSSALIWNNDSDKQDKFSRSSLKVFNLPVFKFPSVRPSVHCNNYLFLGRIVSRNFKSEIDKRQACRNWLASRTLIAKMLLKASKLE